MVPAQTFLQERAPVELRGRVFAVQLMLSNFASIVPLLLLGGLADLIGVDRTLVLIGVLIAVAGAISVRIAPGRAPWHAAPAARRWPLEREPCGWVYSAAGATPRARAGTGRQAWLRAMCPLGRESSSLSERTARSARANSSVG